MKYHKREKIYCLSNEDRVYHFELGDKMIWDCEANEYFYFLYEEKETSLDFFKIEKPEILYKLELLGYKGNNDIREIHEWLLYTYRLTYSVNYSRNYIESHLVIDGLEAAQFLSVSVENRDERSIYYLQKKILESMMFLFRVNKVTGEIRGPSTAIFREFMEEEKIEETI